MEHRKRERERKTKKTKKHDARVLLQFRAAMILGRATSGSGSGNSGGRPPRGSGSSASLLGRSHFLLLPSLDFFPFSLGATNSDCNPKLCQTLNYIESIFFLCSFFRPKRRQILFSAHLQREREREVDAEASREIDREITRCIILLVL